MRRIIFTAALALGSLSGFIQGATVAYFTDSATSTANQFTTGTVQLGGVPTSAFITFSNLIPGDTVTSSITVQKPSSSLPFTYSVSSAIPSQTNVLGDKLTLQINLSSCAGTTLYGSSGSAPLAATSLIPGRSLVAGADNEVLCFKITLPSDAGSSYAGGTATASFTFSATTT